MVLVSAMAFVAIAPFARHPLTPVPAFVSAYESALVANDVITAALIFALVIAVRLHIQSYSNIGIEQDHRLLCSPGRGRQPASPAQPSARSSGQKPVKLD